MRATAVMLREAPSSSICFIDELGKLQSHPFCGQADSWLGRSTSTQDGFAISVAACEALLETGSSVLCSAHFVELQRLFATKPGLTGLHLEVSHDQGRNALVMQYKVAPGINKELRYGLKLAASTSLPKFLCSKAEITGQQLREKLLNRQKSSTVGRVLASRKALLDLRETLRQISEHNSKLELDALRSWLHHPLNEVLNIP